MRIWHVLLATLSALALIAIVGVWLDLDTVSAAVVTGSEPHVLLVLGLAIVIALVLSLVARDPERRIATLIGTMIWIPWIAGLAASALYFTGSSGDQFWKTNAVVLGGGFAIAFWLIYAIVDHDFAMASRQSPGWHGLLQERLEQLKQQASKAPVQSEVGTKAHCEAQANVMGIVGRTIDDLNKPGLRWVTRTGFNGGWTAYHNAEEDFISFAPSQWIQDVAINDILRLFGSKMKRAKKLREHLGRSLIELDPNLKPYVTRLVPEAEAIKAKETTVDDAKQDVGPSETSDTATTSAGPQATTEADRPTTKEEPVRPRLFSCACWIAAALALGRSKRWSSKAADVAPVTDNDLSDQEAKKQAPQTATGPSTADQRSRLVILSTHRALNAYRGAGWAELGRARWHLTLTTTVTGMFAFLVLALALVRNIGNTELTAGWAYFLVGAVAGLFLRLYFASSEQHVSDDYGLDAARLYQTPLLCGVAAVIGVVLMASIAGSNVGDLLNPEVSPTAPPVAVESSSPEPIESALPESSALPAPEESAVVEEQPSAVAETEPSGLAQAPPSAISEPTVAPEAESSAGPSGMTGASPSPNPAEAQSTTATLKQAFDLESYPLGLVVAIAFGLTPNLVLRRLGVSVAAAKAAIVASRPAT
jgi:hypothetical protein